MNIIQLKKLNVVIYIHVMEKIHRHLEVSKKESRGSIFQRRHGTSSRNSGYLKEIFAQQKVFIQKDWTVVGGL